MPTVDEFFQGGRRQSWKTAGCTVGRGINVSLAVNFLCVLICSLVVVGSLARLQQQVKDHPDSANHSHSCILYASHHHSAIEYGTSYSCEYVIASFTITAIVTFILLVVSIIRVVLALDLWYTSIVEMVVLVVAAVMSFIAGVIISIGFSVTCSAVKDYYDSQEDECKKKIPDGEGFYYYHEVDSSQAGAWVTFLFIAVALLVFIVRVVVFLRRRRRPGAEDTQALNPASGEREKLTASQTKPV